MSKVVVFYEKEGNIRGTVVNGHAFIHIAHILSNFNYNELCDFVDRGAENNGYHWNAFNNEYEFWSAGKESVKQSFENIDQVNSFQCDAKFQVDIEKSLVPFN